MKTYERYAKIIVEQVVAVQPGENVLIEISNVEDGLGTALIRAVYAAGGRPFYSQLRDGLKSAWLMSADEQALRMQADWDQRRMEQMDVYIGLRSSENPFDLSGIPNEQSQLYRRHYEVPVHFETRLPKTRWLALRVPNASMAQAAGMSTEAFRKFYFDCCCVNYQAFARCMEPLARRLKEADRIKIHGKDVQLQFRKGGINVCVCCGSHNLPAGEVFTAPIRDSVEGFICYNTPSVFENQKFEGISLKFQKGRITDIACRSGDLDRLKAIFDLDDGARYIGEFAIGTNPFINQVVGDILFDEKASGSFHFTPGRTYHTCGNGNQSSIHWDLIYRMLPENGGGEIWFDDVLIQKDGRFVPEDLQPLNPERLRTEISEE